ncbi:MAG: hypothetical protein Q9161_002037 [Pseudevernia consocians]
MHLFLVLILAAITLVAGEIPGYSFGVANQNETFDFVIIGGGTAGLTIAARLVEATSNRVAIIEAGGFYEVDSGSASEIPGEAFAGVNTDPTDIPSKVDWGFVTTPQLALGGRDARKEVILSAGAFQSPQLLMVSGIGPSHTMKQYNISLISHLPGVGQNMWDNFFFGPSYRVNVVTDSQISQNPQYTAQITAQYINNQSGPLTYAAGYAGYEKLPYRSNLSASTNTSLTYFPPDWPEIGYLPIEVYTGYPSQPATAMLNDGFNYGTIYADLIAPLSRGNVTIKSTDTSDLPIISPNWLSHPADVEVAIAGFKRARQIFENMANITIGPEKLPGPAVQTDDDILTFIRQSGSQQYHASATCAMGKAGDVNAVVDSQARVFGVRGLRVVDASAFPFLPPGLPQSTVYMLAEKIADDIKRGRS